VDALTRNIWAYVVLVLALVLLQYKFWFGQGNWRQVEQLRAQVQAQQAENRELLRRNKALAAEVKDLKTGVDAVEERARNEMGMIKSGETFYRVVDPEKKLDAPPPPDAPKP
jgi:cell division protein FtsB